MMNTFLADKPIISYDFDGVLHVDMYEDRIVKGLYHNSSFNDVDAWVPFRRIHNQIREQAADYNIVIVTARDTWNLPELWQFVNKHKLPIKHIFCTNNGPKCEVLGAIQAIRHYDDRDFSQELAALELEFVRVYPGPHITGRPSQRDYLVSKYITKEVKA